MILAAPLVVVRKIVIIIERLIQYDMDLLKYGAKKLIL